jgi:hypothetical protein
MVETRVGARGERRLTAHGKEHVVLLTNRALAEAERTTGKGVLELARAGTNETISMRDVAGLLQAGLDAGRQEQGLRGRAMARHSNGDGDAWDLLDALGFGQVAGAVLEALAEVLFYAPEGEDASPPSP